jgi:rare lipoprotein A
MRLFSTIVAIATVTAWMGIHVDAVSAQSFDERWSIIPKAHAEPAPVAPGQTEQVPQTQPPIGGEPTRGSKNRSATRSFKRVFSGKASYYSYRTGKTASGSLFDRNLLTAAHRSLPFGTRVRVTDLATSKSVVVRITDRGPMVRNRVLDLSLGAARSLGITDRGVAQVRAEVLGTFSSPSRKWQDTMSPRARHPLIKPPASSAGGQSPILQPQFRAEHIS